MLEPKLKFAPTASPGGPTASPGGHRPSGGSAARRGFDQAQVEQKALATKAVQDSLVSSKTFYGDPQNMKFMIFALDLGQTAKCKMSKMPKSLEDFKDKICDALGVNSEGQCVDAIFAGYQGLERATLNNDRDFENFMATVEKTDETPRPDGEEESELVKELRSEIESLNKEQDRICKRFAQERKELQEQITVYEGRLDAMKKEIEDQRQQFQRRLLKEQAARQQVEQERDKAKAETEKVKDQLAKVAAVYEEKMREQKEKFDAERKRLMAKIKTLQEDLAKANERIQNLEEQVADLEAKVSELEAEIRRQAQKITELEKEVKRLDLLSKQQKRINDELRAKYDEVRAKLAKYEDLETVKIDEPDPWKFEWTITGMKEKLKKWERGRATHSSEFCLEAVDGDLMLEFFPKGDNTSYEGFCALKVRCANNTKIRWSLKIGDIFGGWRCDHYERHLWWCRSGIVWNNFCTEYDLERQIDENDSMTIVFETSPMAELDSMQEPVDVGRDPFAHRSMNLPMLGENLPNPSCGEKLLNPAYFRHGQEEEEKPGGFAMVLTDARATSAGGMSYTGAGYPNVLPASRGGGENGYSRLSRQPSRLERMRNRTAPSRSDGLLGRVKSEHALGQTWDQNTWRGETQKTRKNNALPKLTQNAW